MMASVTTLAIAPPTLAADEVPRRAMRLVAIARGGERISLHDFAALPDLLTPGDLVVVNDAATLPASLAGLTARGEPFELRLAGPPDGAVIGGIVFGGGNWQSPTEDRPAAPPLAVGDRVRFGVHSGRIASRHGRRAEVMLDDEPWRVVYDHGTPIQYAYRRHQLALFDVQNAYAARPWAVEMASAGRGLTWDVLTGLRRRGVAVASVTHAAGLSSTGDRALDTTLPWPERYDIPLATAALIDHTRNSGGRVIAIGTSVVRALEASGGRAGEGIAAHRIAADTTLRVVDGIVSGLHIPGESHFELLRAFVPERRLTEALAIASAHRLSGHELGDGCLIV